MWAGFTVETGRQAADPERLSPSRLGLSNSKQDGSFSGRNAMARCDCGKIQVDCVGWCGCLCVDETGSCIVVCNGNVFGPFHEWDEEATADLHTHGPVPLVDMVKLLNLSCKGGIKVNVPSSRFDETVELEMKGNLSAMLKKLKLEHVR
jgi:hypothetical protein